MREFKNRSYKEHNYMKHEMDVRVENLSTVLANLKANGAWGIQLHYIDGYDDNEEKVIVRFATDL